MWTSEHYKRRIIGDKQSETEIDASFGDNIVEFVIFMGVGKP